MALFDGKTPAERNKTIAAVVLGVIALVFMARMLFGGDTKKSTGGARTSPTPRSTASQTSGFNADKPNMELVPPTPINYNPLSPGGAEAGRNIFAYYVKPVAPAKPSVAPSIAPATPTPTPPLLLGSLSTQNVYARTGDFALQVSGDKFTPGVRVYIDGQELPTQFTSAQQISTTVPASAIAAPGGRQVQVRTPDNQLYSNTATLNVMQPPVPTMTFVGYIGRPGNKSDTAVLKNQKNELVSVKIDDLVDTRFRVTNISERSVELTDKDLKIKHTLPYVEGRAGANPPSSRLNQPPQPPPKSDEEGDEEP